MWKSLFGTLKNVFQLGLAGVTLKNSSGNLLVRNAADSADSELTASKVNVSGNSLVINSDAAGSGADYKITLARPSSGMSGDVTLTLPVDDGSANQVLQTDGSGNLSWATAGDTSACRTVDTTSLAFGDSSPVAMFTLPANAVVEAVRIFIDTAFDGTPTVSIGVSGTTSKYMGTTDSDLTKAAGTIFEVTPGLAANGSTESLIATYSAGSATQGAARIEVDYSVPA